MRAFIISDLHLGNGNNDDTAKNNFKLLVSKIRDEVSPDDELLFVILGDIVDGGKSEGYIAAVRHLSVLKQELKDFKVNFEFIPGNHDLIDKKLDDFDKFIREMGADYSFMASSAVSKEYDGVNFIFADSTLTRDYSSSGKLDLHSIHEQVKNERLNIIFCHHALSHRSDDKHNCVENGDAISSDLRKMGIKFYFHSHTHTCDITLSEERVSEIGCGSISKNIDDMPGINNQFSVVGIRDERIVKIERWIKTNDGKNGFAYEELYPEKKKFTDPKMIDKIKYDDVPSPHIVRRIYQSHSKNSMFSFDEAISCIDALNKTNRIFLLGNSGDGKSIELKKLAHDLYETPYFPFIYYLKNYTGDNINNIIPKEYKGLKPDRLVLIFDGYDEIQETYRHTFEGKLNDYLDQNNCSKVIVSTRRNFCKASESGQSRTLINFKEYEFERITDSNIKDYLSELGIDPDEFIKAAELSKVSAMLYTPFYLDGLAKIFLAEKKLPQKSLIMEEMINYCFENDDEKYSNFDIGESKYEQFQYLENVAFAMQLMRETQITEEEYQQIMSKAQRNLIKPSGLFSRSDNTWQFTHNNFREYLAAKRLKNMPFQQVQEYCCVEKKIKPSWDNVFGYLICLSEDSQLQEWVKDNACETLIKYNPDSLDPSQRFEVFKQVFEEYEKNYSDLYDCSCSESELAYFAYSTKGINYLIGIINNPANRVSLHNALRIMQHFPDTRGNRTEIRNCLLEFCRDHRHNHSSDVRSAIHVLCQSDLCDPAVTKQLMELFYTSEDDFIRTGMYEYLVYANEQDNYVQFYLDGIHFITYSFRSEGKRILNEAIELVRGLKAMSSSESISLVLEWFCKSESVYFHYNDEVFCTLSSKAAKLYQDGNHELFDVMYDCWLWAVKYGKHKEGSAVSNFFIATNSYQEAVLRLINTTTTNVHIGMLLYEYPIITDVFEELYIENRLPNGMDFAEFVKRNFGSSLYNRFSEIIYKTEGKMLPEPPPQKDYDRERKNASLEYLLCLFERSKYEALIDGLLLEVRNDNITVAELEERVEAHEYYLPISRVEFAARRLLFPHHHIKDFFAIVNWQEFSIDEIYKLTTNESLLLNDDQKKIVIEMVKNECEKRVLDDAFSEDGGFYTHVCNVVRFLVLYEIALPVKELPRLTAIPWYGFSDNNDTAKYEYLERNYSQNALINQVISDVKNRSVDSETMKTHIDYLSRCGCDSIVDDALNICVREESSDLFRNALDYLYGLYGGDYIEDEILPRCGKDTALYVAQKFRNINHEQLKAAMERLYCVEPDKELQAYLITFNSKIALEDYVKYVSETNSVPKNDGNLIGGTTEAVSSVSDPQLIPLLIKLTKIVFNTDFQDSEFYSLRNSLYKAFVNCVKSNPEYVLKTVTDLADSAGTEDERFYFFRLKNDAVKEAIEVQDIPLSISVVKRILSHID